MRRREKARACSTEKYLKKLFDVLDEVKDRKVLVEGIKDEKTLRRIGFSDVHVINRYKSFYNISEKVRGEVLILSDFDPEGDKIANKLSKMMIRFGTRVKKSERNNIRRIFIKNNLNTIEGLNRVISKYLL